MRVIWIPDSKTVSDHVPTRSATATARPTAMATMRTMGVAGGRKNAGGVNVRLGTNDAIHSPETTAKTEKNTIPIDEDWTPRNVPRSNVGPSAVPRNAGEAGPPSAVVTSPLLRIQAPVPTPATRGQRPVEGSPARPERGERA